MKISTPLKEFFRYESGAVHDEFFNTPLRFRNGLASREVTICVNHVVVVLLYQSNTVSLNFTLNVTFTSAVTNIIHQNSDYLQFLSHTHSHTQQKLMTS